MNALQAFWLLALLLVAATLALLMPGLWRGHSVVARGPDGALSLLREQLAAVERERAAGELSPQAAQQRRDEIGRRVLEEQAAAAPWHDGPSRRAALGVALAVPALAVALYAGLGQPLALVQAPRTQAGSQPTLTQVEAMASQLAQSLEARARSGEASPQDAAGWALLGRTLAQLQQFAQAERALARALELQPDNAELLADRADLLALLQGQSPDGEPMRLVERALRLDPDQPKALALAAAAAWSRGDTALALRQWQRALAHLPPGSAFAQQLTRQVQQAREAGAAREAQGLAKDAAPLASTSPRIANPAPWAAATAASRVSGRVSLSPALAAQVRPDDTVFIVARAAQGPRMPLAILRLRAGDLPAAFTLDDDAAMAPELRLSRFSQVVVSVRLSRSGEALPRSGDPIGAPVTTTVGARDVALVIDRLQP